MPTLFSSMDATLETPRMGRLINHSAQKPNLSLKVVEMEDGTPRIALLAAEDIKRGKDLRGL